jgi:hypothetical protein
MKIADRICSLILLLAGILFGLGSYHAYQEQPLILLWALSATLAALLLASINLLRTQRPGDRSLARVCAVGCMAWCVVSFQYGALIGNIFDPRVLVQGLTALLLTAFSIDSALPAKKD